MLGWAGSRLALWANADRVRGSGVLVVQSVHAGKERKRKNDDRGS
jgi:hypothetical protein